MKNKKLILIIIGVIILVGIVFIIFNFNKVSKEDQKIMDDINGRYSNIEENINDYNDIREDLLEIISNYY